MVLPISESSMKRIFLGAPPARSPRTQPQQPHGQGQDETERDADEVVDPPHRRKLHGRGSIAKRSGDRTARVAAVDSPRRHDV